MSDTSLIGIDLGSCTIEVAYYRVNKQLAENAKFSTGKYFYPTFYGYNPKTKTELFGDSAKQALSKKGITVAYEFKRFIGKSFDDKIIENDIKRAPYKSVKMGDSSVGIEIDKGKIMSPIEIYSKLLNAAIDDLKTSQVRFENVVVTVPLSFGDNEREAIKHLFDEFSLNNIAVLNESTAAAIDFGYGDFNTDDSEKKESDSKNKKKPEGNFVVFDYGGGTLDISVIQYSLSKNNTHNFNVLAHGGLRNNGGSDIDELIAQYVISETKDGMYEIDEIDDEVAFLKSKTGKSQLKVECEKCKISLSSNSSYTFTLPQPDGEDNEAEVTIELEDFKKICLPLFTQAVDELKRVIDMANVNISEILMVGGTSSIPYISQMIQQRFGIKPTLSDHPLFAVSRGAAIKCAELKQKAKTSSTEVATYSVGIATYNQLFGIRTVQTIIPEQSKLPFTGRYEFVLPNENQKSIQLDLYRDTKIPLPSNFIGTLCVDIEGKCHKGSRVDLFIKMNQEGMLNITIELPQSTLSHKFDAEIKLNH
ncbi:heat shock protein 70kD, putative [Entamoeba dispar SAW760]|uniref:Heat shock protein 70kD, putative n=1 Tax=Entamoeba dispar (strain ATCC PRA-260 / SAW760) TaxID=370354 RepID=B0ERU6_ENTDS|nr:heat shock protein 70kD, putative [Entamoeba dispar SAW760]EDR22741.1 heat shock protein 70kD, putative [Entamoeba dispar SAW760]|eukprot:EDR22741.1 heat shock protein 70kD, putative [Entamoeba dispar SAW760]